MVSDWVYNKGMRPRYFPALLLASLVLLVAVPFPRALAAPPALTIVTGLGTTQADDATARYDFGTRRLSDESPLGHLFTLRNANTASVTVDRLQSSCGCTTASLDGDLDLPLTVGPGGLLSVRVRIAPHRLAPGPVEKSVWVFTHGASDAPVLLEITGTMQDDPDTAPVLVPTAAPVLVPVVTAPAPVALDAPQVGRPAQAFTRADVQGRLVSLASMRGHSVALFFFCGCPWCADVATLWGREQRKGSARTLVVFAGTGAEARAFATRNGLDIGQTTLLPDPDSALTEGVYKLNSCPRAFVLDAAGLIRYTNDHADDQPRRAPAAVLVQRTRQALGR